MQLAQDSCSLHIFRAACTKDMRACLKIKLAARKLRGLAPKLNCLFEIRTAPRKSIAVRKRVSTGKDFPPQRMWRKTFKSFEIPLRSNASSAVHLCLNPLAQRYKIRETHYRPTGLIVRLSCVELTLPLHLSGFHVRETFFKARGVNVVSLAAFDGLLCDGIGFILFA
jgi:hypothetical protein